MDADSFIQITIPNAKTKIPRTFTITEGNIDGINFLEIFRRYASFRPRHTTHDRFFVSYFKSKCSCQCVGINTMGAIPKKIATYLGLRNAGEYTGHCLRKSSAALLFDAGASLPKKRNRWRSTSTEEYIEMASNKSKKQNTTDNNSKSVMHYNNI